MKGSKGFSLIEILVSVAVLGVVSLGLASMISNQMQAVAYVEDQLEKSQIERAIESVLTDYNACGKSFENLQIPANASQNRNVGQLKDMSDQVMIRSNTQNEKLRVLQMRLRNVSVSTTTGGGTVELEVPLARTRKGGGPDVFKPLKFTFQVAIDASRRVLSCSSARAGVSDFCMCGYNELKYSCDCCEGSGWILMGSFDQDRNDANGVGRTSISGPLQTTKSHYMMNVCVKR